MQEHVDGCVISDLHISPGGYLQWGFQYEEFSKYIANLFNIYQPKLNVRHYKTKFWTKGGVWSTEERNRTSYCGSTKVHLDFKRQRKRWYPDGKKRIPEDVLITPTSLLLWYLGDGSLDRFSGYIVLCTDGYNLSEHQLLQHKLSLLSINAKIRGQYRTREKKYYHKLLITRKNVKKFFDVIGYSSPVKCYNYKFTIPTSQSIKNWSIIAKQKMIIKKADATIENITSEDLDTHFQELGEKCVFCDTKLKRIDKTRSNSKSKNLLCWFVPKEIKEEEILKLDDFMPCCKSCYYFKLGPRKERQTKYNHNTIIELHQAGLDFNKISQKIGCATTNVRYVVNKNKN